MAPSEDTDATFHAECAVVLGWLAFLTLTAFVLMERFAELPPIAAAYAGAVYLLVSD